MVQSPSWEANRFAVSQEIPHISRNPKVHYRTHKRPPPVPILGQPNPVHIPTSYLLEIHPNIIQPSTPRSPQWSLSLRFPPTKTLYTPFSSPIRATCPAHLSTFCSHCIYACCFYLRTNSDLCHLQYKLIGFYNRDEKCLQRGTDWVFTYNPTLCPHCIYVFCIYLRTNSDLCHLQHKLIGFYNRD